MRAGRLTGCREWARKTVSDNRTSGTMAHTCSATSRFRNAITILVYDRGMSVSVNLQTVHARKLAAVRREAVGSAWGPALARSGSSFAASQACGLMATTFFSTTTRHSRARRYCATSVSRSRAHLKLRARRTRPKRKGARLLSRSTAAVQSLERGARRDRKMDGGESEGVRWALVGDIRRSDAESGRH
jgi:hypothetical protein